MIARRSFVPRSLGNFAFVLHSGGSTSTPRPTLQLFSTLLFIMSLCVSSGARSQLNKLNNSLFTPSRRYLRAAAKSENKTSREKEAPARREFKKHLSTPLKTRKQKKKLQKQEAKNFKFDFIFVSYSPAASFHYVPDTSFECKTGKEYRRTFAIRGNLMFLFS